MRWINLHKLSSKHPKPHSWTIKLEAQLSFLLKNYLLPLLAVYTLFSTYTLNKVSKAITFPPVFCTSQFSPSPPWANYSFLQDPIFQPPSLAPNSLTLYPALGYFVPFTHTDPQSSLHPLLLSVCAVAFTSCSHDLHFVYQSQGVADLPYKERAEISPLSFHHFFFLWKGDTVLVLYLNVFFLHILYPTAEVQMGSKQFTNVFSLNAHSVNYSPWYFLALLFTEWDFTGFPFLGYQIQNSVSFTGCNTSFEEFIKGFREGKGKLHLRRKLCVVIQQDNLPVILLKWLWKCMC